MATNNKRLDGRVAVITGGTKGIGRATATLFAREGASVVVCARDRARGEQFAQEMADLGMDGVVFLQADASIAEEVEGLIAESRNRFGRIDVLISNVGFLASGTAPETSVEQWHQVLDANLSSAFYLAKFGIPVLAEAGGGSIVLTAGEFGLVGTTAAVAYCAAKGGVVNMTRALAVDCAPLGIRVNCVCPGPVRTSLLEEWFSQAPSPEDKEAAQTKPILLGRIAEAAEIAEAHLFLASDASSYITGSVLVVDGGLTAWYGL